MASKFRTSFTHKEGLDAAHVVQARVINVNVVKWTVDVITQFDRKRYLNIQCGSPYIHHSRGEGMCVFPEVGATCMVCLPSDSSPPYIQAFVMAHELVDDASDDAPLGTSSHGEPPANATDASFAGGRPRAIPGSIYMKTRDGNFFNLLRGGILQLGSTELAQRIYIPLGNLISDISENYEHHNAAGSVKWGIQDGPSLERFPGQFLHTFRVFANDRYADVKFACGKVLNPMPEPDAGVAQASAGVGEGKDNPIICELAVSPKGFVAENGEVADPSAVKASVMRFVFDRTGNVFMRAEGNVYYLFKKKLTFKVTDEISMQTDTHMGLTAKSGIDIDGGEYAHIKGTVVRLGKGQLPVARQGDVVSIPLIAAPVLINFFSPPIPGTPIACTITTTPNLPLAGTIATGAGNVLA